MTLPGYEHVRFAKSPLKLVVCQVRFPVLPQFGEGSFVTPFIHALRPDYPGVSREQQVELQLSPTGVKTGAPDFLWRLATRDNDWAVVFGEASVALESRRYTTIEEFSGRLERVVEAARIHLDIAESTRVGLRYINEIRYPDANTLDEWRDLLHPDFLGFAASGVIEGRVEQMLQEAQFLREDGVLLVRHGLLTGAVVAPLPPALPPSSRFYLIDLDYADGMQRNLDTAELVLRIRDYNEVMSKFFRATLTEKLYRYLEPSDASAR